MFLFLFILLLICVGFCTPIDFKLGTIFDWLETTQSVAKRVLELYSRNFHVDDFGITESTMASVRSQKELELQSIVLPHLDLNFMAVSPMEIALSSHVHVTNLDALVPQTRGSCTPNTPYVKPIKLFIFNLFCRIELKAYIDDSGPTLCINTESETTARMLSKMLAKTVRTTLPKMSTAQMKDTGFIDGGFY